MASSNANAYAHTTACAHAQSCAHAQYLKDNEGHPMVDLLKMYTGAHAFFIQYQAMLREFDVINVKRVKDKYPDIFLLRNKLNEFINNAPKSLSAITTFRGSDIPPVIDSHGKFIEWGFAGSSLKQIEAEKFIHTKNRCCLYEFVFPPRSPILFISSISSVATEEEVFIPAGAEFYIEHVRTENGIQTYKCNFTGIVHEPHDNPLYRGKPIVTGDVKATLYGRVCQILNRYNSSKKYATDEKTIRDGRKSIDTFIAQQSKVYDIPDSEILLIITEYIAFQLTSTKPANQKLATQYNNDLIELGYIGKSRSKSRRSRSRSKSRRSRSKSKSKSKSRS